jgi:hypothetical protein
MQTHTFTLLLAGVRELTEEVANALYESGCDDALVGSRDGVVFLDFDREAPSFREAVLSAIADVEKTDIGARVAHVEPDDLVTMSEIARRIRRTRESVRQLVSGLRGPGDFPLPVANLKQRSPIWRWTDVSRWFRESLGGEGTPGGGRPARPGAAAPGTGSDAAAINAALDVRHHTGDAQEAMLLLKSLLHPRRCGRGRAGTRRDATEGVKHRGETRTATI